MLTLIPWSPVSITQKAMMSIARLHCRVMALDDMAEETCLLPVEVEINLNSDIWW
jgi:hypothetical protein